MRTIKLYGELGEKFGRIFKLEVKSPAEAIRALSVLVDGFESYLLGSEKNGLGFKVLDSGNQLSEKELGLNGRGTIKIIPVISGANAEGRVLLGAALVAVSLAMTATGVGASVAPYVMNAGVALAIGGAIEMIVGRPKAPDIPEHSENKPSYLFSGAVNTTAQGHPVPLGYGRMIVGSAVISASISTQNLLAGYTKKTRVATTDIYALGSPDAYAYAVPPANYFKRELISYNPSATTWGGGTTEAWGYRFYYYEEYVELQEI